MLASEVVLIIVGVIFLVGSHFVEEKLSQQDIEHISILSEKELKIIAEKQVKKVETEVQNSIDELLEETVETTKRGLEKETNAKIMAVSEYSDTVLESINKTHNEIMFLYSMLNDKQTETADLVGDLQRYTTRIKELEEQLEDLTARAQQTASMEVAPEVKKPVVEATLSDDDYVDTMPEPKDSLLINKNEKILLLYKEGKDEVEIAKALGCGLGEVRLVLGLYNEI